MKILIVSYFFPPLNAVASLRPYSFAKTYARLGHDVTVLTATKPSNPNDLHVPTEGFSVVEVQSRVLEFLYKALGVNSSKSNGSAGSDQNKNGIRSRLNDFRIKRGIFILGRMPDFLDLLVRPSLKALEKRHWDLVISSYGPYYCHAIGHYLKARGFCNLWVADFRDLWTQSHLFRGLFPFTLIEKVLESRYLRSADLLTTVSDDLASQLKSIAPDRPVHVVPNGFDPDDLASLDSAPVFEDNKVHLVYTGTIYPGWKSFLSFLEALNLLQQDRSELCKELEVTFAGADIARLESRCRERGLSAVVTFTGPMPRQDALRLQRDGDILLFFEPDTGTGIATGKLYEYVSSGSRIWRIGGLDRTIAQAILDDTEAGESIGINAEQLRRKLEALLENPTKPTVTTKPEQIQRYRRDIIAESLLRQVCALSPEDSSTTD